MTYHFPDSALIIFCKAPIAGQVKTRLQPAMTAEQAVAAHKQLTLMTLDRAFKHTLCPVILYCAPDYEHDFFQQCAVDYPVLLAKQQGEDLGARIHQAFVETFSSYRHALLMGCDCPSLTAEDLHQALSALHEGRDAVLAPAEDGGYVLVGLNKPQAFLFNQMPWGSNQVMSETRRRANAAKLNWHGLTQQWDVDTIADWERYLKTQTADLSSSFHQALS